MNRVRVVPGNGALNSDRSEPIFIGATPTARGPAPRCGHVRANDDERTLVRHNARLAGSALAALLLFTAACGSDDGDAGSSAVGAPAEATSDAATSDTAATGDTAGGSDAAGGGAGDNPCAVVTEAQWETLFGAGVQKSDASGGKANCNVLTRGTSSGHEVELTNFSVNLANTTFEDQLGYNAPCGSEPAKELSGVGDRAVLDTSCLSLSGRAWVIAEHDGDVYGLFMDAGEPSKADPAQVATVLTTIATEALASL